LREFDLRAPSQDAALADMREYFPDYDFLGPGPTPEQAD
jgi:hypothetical protein